MHTAPMRDGGRHGAGECGRTGPQGPTERRATEGGPWALLSTAPPRWAIHEEPQSSGPPGLYEVRGSRIGPPGLWRSAPRGEAPWLAQLPPPGIGALPSGIRAVRPRPHRTESRNNHPRVAGHQPPPGDRYWRGCRLQDVLGLGDDSQLSTAPGVRTCARSSMGRVARALGPACGRACCLRRRLRHSAGAPC